MKCADVGKLLDAYALGAIGPEDTNAIEEHLADCLRCWDHLQESQKAAALLFLAVPLKEPRKELRRRIMAQAAREARPESQGQVE
jgi:anti-sigma factor RsiW